MNICHANFSCLDIQCTLCHTIQYTEFLFIFLWYLGSVQVKHAENNKLSLLCIPDNETCYTQSSDCVCITANNVYYITQIIHYAISLGSGSLSVNKWHLLGRPRTRKKQDLIVEKAWHLTQSLVLSLSLVISFVLCNMLRQNYLFAFTLPQLFHG